MACTRLTALVRERRPVSDIHRAKPGDIFREYRRHFGRSGPAWIKHPELRVP